VAAARPDLVSRLVLEDPPWTPPRDPAADVTADASNPHEDWLRGLQAIDGPARMAAAAAEHPNWSADDLAAWAASKGRVDPRLFAAEQRFLRRSWPAVARKVQSPTLMFTGETRLGAALDPESAQILIGLGWRVVGVQGAGHNVRRDNHSTYLSELRAFLSGAPDAVPA
jgi:pimeloyl-ACP methyl ester carboxylesterase